MGYQSNYANASSDILLRSAEQQANARRARGELLGNTLQALAKYIPTPESQEAKRAKQLDLKVKELQLQNEEGKLTDQQTARKKQKALDAALQAPGTPYERLEKIEAIDPKSGAELRKQYIDHSVQLVQQARPENWPSIRSGIIAYTGPQDETSLPLQYPGDEWKRSTLLSHATLKDQLDAMKPPADYTIGDKRVSGKTNEVLFTGGLTAEQQATQDRLAQTEKDRLAEQATDNARADAALKVSQGQLALSQKREAREAAKDARVAAGLPAIDIKPGTKEYRLAQDMAYGKITMADFNRMYGRAASNADLKSSVYDTARQLNPNFNPAAFEMGYTLAKNPKVQQQLASLDNVIQAVPDLVKISDQASRTGVPALNKLISAAGYQVGGSKYSNFHAAQITFADELSGALGYGSATDMSREMGLNMTDPNLSPANFSAALHDVVVPFINRKRSTLLNQMGVYGQPGMNPAGDAATGGAKPSASAPSGFSYQDYLKSKGQK